MLAVYALHSHLQRINGGGYEYGILSHSGCIYFIENKCKFCPNYRIYTINYYGYYTNQIYIKLSYLKKILILVNFFFSNDSTFFIFLFGSTFFSKWQLSTTIVISHLKHMPISYLIIISRCKLQLSHKTLHHNWLKNTIETKAACRAIWFSSVKWPRSWG